MRSLNKSPLAILAIWLAITLLLTCRPARAGLVQIYQKYRASLLGENVAASAAGSPAALANNMTIVKLEPESPALSSDLLDLAGSSRRATIEISSPMKRIMELIGHHAPVIVLDSSSQDSSPSSSSLGAQKQQPETVASLTAGQATASSAGSGIMLDSSGQRQPQLQTQSQHQHWTILDTSQLVQQPHQQQQPTAQQQQLIQTSVPSGEQYFHFTPFGLAPTSNLFEMSGAQSAMLNPLLTNQLQQQQQQQQQQVGQSSQNFQQQLNGALAEQQSGPVQPVFLSSYVPELPAAGFQPSAAAPISYAGQALTQFVPASQQAPVQQPNSIQQIQQAQKGPAKSANDGDGDAAGEGPESGRGDEGEPDERTSRGAPGESEDEEPSSSARQSGPADEAADTDEAPNSPSSGSVSYEDKYDSDKDDQQQRPDTSTSQARRHSPPPPPAGLVSVGLNDDCLQCICRASSGCDHLLRCITIGAEEKFCGPFQLTEEYWQKAGSPGDSANNFSSFEECANDADCAVETVTNYMKKYYRDCDGDENITCIDYARLHRLRPDECANGAKLRNQFQGYWEKFERCAEGYNRTRNGDDEDI